VKANNKAKIYLTKGLRKISEIIAFFLKKKKNKTKKLKTYHQEA